MVCKLDIIIFVICIMDIKIAIFTFNTEAQIFCYSSKEQKECKTHGKFFKSKCIVADFTEEYIKYIKYNNNGKLPEILIVALQESSIKNPFKGFRSDRLIQTFYECIQKENLGYKMYKEKLEGMGQEGVRGLRMGIFIAPGISGTFGFTFYKPFFNSKISHKKGQHFGKGAMHLNLNITKINGTNILLNLQFVNTHLPFLESDIHGQGKDIRDQTVEETLKYFNSELENIQKQIQINKIPSHHFLIGDLNYRIDFGENNKSRDNFINLVNTEPTKYNLSDFLVYKQYDQLTNFIQSGKKPLNLFREGINNNGPNFLPTCKLQISKIPSSTVEETKRSYQIEKNKSIRIPSWCDRVLYTTDLNEKSNITCDLYETFDRGYTCKSDHKPVIALYTIKLNL